MAEAMEFDFTIAEEESKQESSEEKLNKVKSAVLDPFKGLATELERHGSVLEYKSNTPIFGSKALDGAVGVTYKDGVMTIPKSSPLSLNTINTKPFTIHPPTETPNWLQSKPKEPKRPPRTLKGMTMALKGEDVIQVSYRGDFYAHTPTTLGLMKGGKPTKIWEYLVLLCNNKGVINFPNILGEVEYLKQKVVIQQRLKRLREKLESEFDVKIKRGRDYNYHKVFEFKSIVFRDEFTPQHIQYEKQIEEDRIVTDMYYSASDDIKKNSFQNLDIEDEENIRQNF